MSKGIFVKQTQTTLVKGRQTWKIANTHPLTCENTSYEIYRQENTNFKRTELEELYFEFCKKAFNVIMSDPSLNGENIPEKIIFSHFEYEIIPKTIQIK